MKSKRRVVILPTYNEAANIAALVAKISALKSFEIIIVDDNSPDGTADLARKSAAARADVSLVLRPRKSGLASAYADGFALALERGYDEIFMMDADFSHNPAYLPEMSAALEKSDMAVGSRYTAGGGIAGWPLRRKIISGFGNFYARVVAGLPVRDCTSGFIAMRRRVLERLGPRPSRAEGYGFLIELKHKALAAGFSVDEIPITFTDRAAGKSKISRKIIIEAMALAWRLRFAAPAVSDGNK